MDPKVETGERFDIYYSNSALPSPDDSSVSGATQVGLVGLPVVVVVVVVVVEVEVVVVAVVVVVVVAFVVVDLLTCGYWYHNLNNTQLHTYMYIVPCPSFYHPHTLVLTFTSAP